MKKLFLLSLLIGFQLSIFGQTQGSPMPYGPRIINTEEVSISDFERIPVMYDNGQIKDWIHKDSLKVSGSSSTVGIPDWVLGESYNKGDLVSNIMADENLMMRSVSSEHRGIYRSEIDNNYLAPNVNEWLNKGSFSQNIRLFELNQTYTEGDFIKIPFSAIGADIGGFFVVQARASVILNSSALSKFEAYYETGILAGDVGISSLECEIDNSNCAILPLLGEQWRIYANVDEMNMPLAIFLDEEYNQSLEYPKRLFDLVYGSQTLPISNFYDYPLNSVYFLYESNLVKPGSAFPYSINDFEQIVGFETYVTKPDEKTWTLLAETNLNNNQEPIELEIWSWDSLNGNMTVNGSSGINNTGQSVFAVGNGAAENNQGYGTIGIGYNTLQNQGSAKNHNIGIGTQAGQNFTGNQGVLLGYNAGQNAGSLNLIAIGLDAAKNWTGANDGSTIAMGRGALATPTTTGFSLFQGSDIVAIGTDAGKNAASIYNDVYIGYQAGRDAGIAATVANQYSGNNVGIGLSALRGVVGTDNIGIGGGWTSNGGGTPLGAGRGLKGNGNIILGAYAGHSAVGNGNILMGNQAQGAINGSRNVILQGIGTITGFSHNKNTILNAQYMSGSNIGTFDPHAQTKNELTAIGWNYAIYGNGTTRKLSIYPTAAANPSEPRERLDLGSDGYMAGKGLKLDNSSNILTVEADLLTVNRTQKFQDATGTIALVETSGKRFVINVSKAISIPDKTAFDIALFDFCPLYEPGFIDFELTWEDGSKIKKLSTATHFNDLALDNSSGCLNLTGLANKSISLTSANNPKLILIY